MEGFNSTVRLCPVPAHVPERLRITRAGDFTFVESRNFEPVPMHAHEPATITFVLDGALEEAYRAPRRSESYAASSMFTRPPAEPHADRFAPEGAYTAVLEVDPRRMGALRGAFDRVSHHRASGWASLASRIGRELGQPDAASALALEGLALEALAMLLRAQDAPSAPAWFQRAVDLLHDRFTDPALRISELASCAGVHPVHFVRVFRARYGRPPAAYIRELRLAAAARALSTTARPIAEIANTFGFADQSHFTRTFRVAYGTSPAAFRGR